MTEAERQQVLIVTGMSGAGRSTVANALEDLGWYVVDNLPPQMLRPLVELAGRAGSNLPQLAAVVDVRGRNFFPDLQEIIRALREGVELRIIFLDANDQVLVRRFESVRRPHPLQGGGTLLDGIASERARLREIREASDYIVDTSDLNVHQLAATIADAFGDADSAEVQVTVASFGFKYGLPTDADMVVDARFLPNPFWVEGLREHTGLDDDVRDYVLEQPDAGEFLDRLEALLDPVLTGYDRENKRYATVAVGCTGGKHRSVALAQEFARRLDTRPGVSVTVRHRDLGRE